jgi:hypothetical protein
MNFNALILILWTCLIIGCQEVNNEENHIKIDKIWGKTISNLYINENLDCTESSIYSSKEIQLPFWESDLKQIQFAKEYTFFSKLDSNLKSYLEICYLPSEEEAASLFKKIKNTDSVLYEYPINYRSYYLLKSNTVCFYYCNCGDEDQYIKDFTSQILEKLINKENIKIISLKD